MRKISKSEYIPNRNNQDGEEFEPFLSPEDQVEGVILELTVPIPFADKEELKELTINPPTGGQLTRNQGMKGSEGSRTNRFFAECCNVTATEIQALHLRDYTRLGAIIWGFSD